MNENGNKLPRAKVSHDLCAGVAMCLQLAPGAFRLNAAGQSEFVDGDWDESQLREAEEGCPMMAIALIDDTGSDT